MVEPIIAKKNWFHVDRNCPFLPTVGHFVRLSFFNAEDLSILCFEASMFIINVQCYISH